jgi:hypothetical protein
MRGILLAEAEAEERKAASEEEEEEEGGDGLVFENGRLRAAYGALQAWKRSIFSDPLNYTATWVGADVCSYRGVFCAAAPEEPCERTVGGIDLNGADIAGFLPEGLGALEDLALLHLNSNR